MQRRGFLRVVTASAAALLTHTAAPNLFAQPKSSDDRPNFIFIYTDDQRYDAMGCIEKDEGDKARSPWFKTPNMDRLAREGMRFHNAFVVNSLCSPSRACFLTGQYNHINGVVNNHTEFPENDISHATVLRKAGYLTAYFGKFHHDHQKDRPGFDFVFSFVGQGQYHDCPFNDNGTIVPTKGWVDDVTTNHVISFLKQPHTRPFDMVIGFKSPHDPRTPAPRAADRFDNDSLRPVPNLTVKTPYPPGNAATIPNPTTATTRGARMLHSRLNHYRCVSSADDCLGRILDALDENHLTENTVVLFTSDNGYLFGEHGLGDKRAAYDESMRIPLVIRYPKLIKPNTVCDAMVLNINVAPTFIDLAGEKVPDAMQGRSMKPLMLGDGKTADWRHAFFYEYFYEHHYATPTITAVRTDDAKIIKYPGHDEWTELFDLSSDPYELHNLAHDPAHANLMKRMEQLYIEQLKEVKFTIPQNADKPPTTVETSREFE